MFLAMALICGGDPLFTVNNHCPVVVTNHCPAVKTKSVVANGFNCRAGFCGANGGSGCPSCPNNSGGDCTCGPAGQVKTKTDPKPTIIYSLGTSNCPNGQCPIQRR